MDDSSLHFLFLASFYSFVASTKKKRNEKVKYYSEVSIPTQSMGTRESLCSQTLWGTSTEKSLISQSDTHRFLMCGQPFRICDHRTRTADLLHSFFAHGDDRRFLQEVFYTQR